MIEIACGRLDGENLKTAVRETVPGFESLSLRYAVLTPEESCPSSCEIVKLAGISGIGSRNRTAEKDVLPTI